jgi:hypothetical protein
LSSTMLSNRHPTSHVVRLLLGHLLEQQTA